MFVIKHIKNNNTDELTNLSVFIIYLYFFQQHLGIPLELTTLGVLIKLYEALR